jgi:hypothetical protein
MKPLEPLQLDGTVSAGPEALTMKGGARRRRKGMTGRKGRKSRRNMTKKQQKRRR